MGQQTPIALVKRRVILGVYVGQRASWFCNWLIKNRRTILLLQIGSDLLIAW